MNYIESIFRELIQKESNMGYTDINIYYSDIIGEYITDSFNSIALRLREKFIAWYLSD